MNIIMSTFLFYLIYVLYLSLQLIVTSFTSLLMSGVDLANVILFIIIVAKKFLSRIDWNDLCFFPNIDTKNTRVNYQTFQWRKTFLARMHADQVDLLKLARIKLNFTTLCITCKFYFSIFRVFKIQGTFIFIFLFS